MTSKLVLYICKALNVTNIGWNCDIGFQSCFRHSKSYYTYFRQNTTQEQNFFKILLPIGSNEVATTIATSATKNT